MKLAKVDSIPPMSVGSIEKVKLVEQHIVQNGTYTMHTFHTIHGNVYTRTVFLRKGYVLCGALIKVPTTLTVSGNVIVYIGTEFSNLKGYNVIPAAAGRKQLIIALEDTYITMCLSTEKRTVAEIEKEFTDEYEILLSSFDASLNTIIIGD